AKPFGLFLADRVFSVGKDKRAISTKDIPEQRAGFAPRFGHTGLSQPVRTFQNRFRYRSGHFCVKQTLTHHRDTEVTDDSQRFAERHSTFACPSLWLYYAPQ